MHASSGNNVSSPAQHRALHSTPQADTHKSRVLVVDDAPDIAFMFAFVLEQAGYTVVTAESAFSALDAARRESFDVVVSDIGMPGMNGYELARALHSLPDYAGVPMIAVTGFAEYGDRQQATEAGFDAHLTKPVDPDALLQLVTRLRRRR